MIIPFIASLLIGAAGVLQNTFNKVLAGSLGMPLSLLINSAVLLGIGIALYMAMRFMPEGALPEIYRSRPLAGIPLWSIVPGLLDFFIIATVPWAIGQIGAVRVFIAIIVAQIVVSMLWDFYAESIPFSGTRLIGAFLALAGALIAAR